MRITEDDVVQAAKEWAVRSHKDSFEAESTALEAISALQATLNSDDYDQALKSLYEQYQQS
ncbi:hypothetical protein [Pseudomonas rhizophila]|uniref:Uncharacterized protein n=1 Tax=Pseudomonas rhizophila TaxID=2045200 RepID=A0ABN5JY32_9PSED|nr:hypothetical protein [Pseudomonas rhizophila]AVU77075.1 hypothetical protein CRX69_18430 [Pseudomonas rhizophila]